MGFESRLLCFSTLLFASLTGFSQEILIPYKSGEKYGLCDETGKVVIAPVYDKVEYLEQNYFVFGNKEMRMDTMIGWDDKPFLLEQEHWSVGLLEKDRVLIPQQEFEGFFFYDHFIVVSEDEYQPGNFYLYNLKGEKLLEDRINFFYYNEPNDLGYLAESSERFTFFSLHYGKEPRQSEKFSLAVYDNELQKIDNWLLKDVTEYEFHSHLSLPDLVFCTYKDRLGRAQSKYIRQMNGRFELVDKSALSPEQRSRLHKKEKELEQEDEPMDMEAEGYMGIASAVEIDNYQAMGPDFKGYFIYKDSLVYREPKERKRVKMQKNTELIFLEQGMTQQSGAILYKHKEKYGLLIKGEYSKVRYDSLLYYGSYFIAATQRGKTLLFGLIDGEGAVLLPLEYDSMYGMTKELEVINVRSEDSVHYSIRLHERQLRGINGYYYPGHKNPYVRRQTPGIFVYKGDKCGVITEMGEVIIPIEYDTIAYNGMYLSSRKTNYYILKNEGLYGVVDIAYGVENWASKIGPTLFPYIPANYIENYYNTPGFRLYALYDERYRFMGFANENGVLYFKPE